MIYPPDLKNGNFLQIEKSLSRAIGIYPFNLRQIKLIYAIIDKTYGWGKSKDDISVSQLSEMTGIQENHCSSTIKSLVAINVITKEKGKYAYKIGINKFFRDWKDWDMSKEWWNNDDENEQPQEEFSKKTTHKAQDELTTEQLECWELAKKHDYWGDKVPTQSAFLSAYNRKNSGLKEQFENGTLLTAKNKGKRSFVRKSFLNKENNGNVINGECEVINE